MAKDLDKHDIEVIECLLSSWDDEASFGLYSWLSYQDVFNLCSKLNLLPPPNLVAMLEKRCLKNTNTR